MMLHGNHNTDLRQTHQQVSHKAQNTGPEMPVNTDPVALTAALVQCPSVTPAEGGALVLLETLLGDAGFECSRVDRGGICNLFARWGRKRCCPPRG